MNTHGLNNDFLYAVSKVRVQFENDNLPNVLQNEGTGFFIRKDDKDYFITNRHVLDPERIKDAAGQGYKMYQVFIDHRNFESTSQKPLAEEYYVKNCFFYLCRE